MKNISHVIFYTLLFNLFPSTAMYAPDFQHTERNNRDLGEAARNNKLKLVKKFIEERGIPVNYNPPKQEGDVQPLYWAAIEGHVKIMEFLIAAKADINKKSGWGKREPMYAAVQSGNRDAVDCLMQAKADINVQDKDGETPLFACADDSADVGMARYLIEQYGAQVDIFNKHGVHLFHKACRWGDSVELVQLLLEKKINSNIVDGDGDSPLRYAAANGGGKVYNFLVSIGTDEVAKQHVLDEQLYQATLEGDTVSVRKLLHARANPNYAGLVCFTPLQLAALFKGKRTSPSLVEQLLQCKADVNAKNNCDSTALHFAAEHSVEISKLLVHAGALVNAQNKQGKKPVECARHANVKKFLTSVGEQKEGE